MAAAWAELVLRGKGGKGGEGGVGGPVGGVGPSGRGTGKRSNRRGREEILINIHINEELALKGIVAHTP